MSDATPLLRVDGLRKWFPVRGGLFGRTVAQVQAVDGISFEVAKGETLGIVGESGCGKSTTARLLIRLIEPDKGDIIFDGLGLGDGLTLSDMRRQVQMVFQDSYASLNPRLTIADTIAFGPRVHGMPAAQADARAQDLLRKVGLAPELFAGRYPHELSGGQRQRVNIARALALEPRLLILDEAVSALDKSIEAQVLNLLVDLKAELGLTYLFISHDLSVVAHVSDRVAVMYLGKICEVARSDDLYQRPAHPYTDVLLHSIPVPDPTVKVDAAVRATGEVPSPVLPPSGCRFRTRCPLAQERCAVEEPQLQALGDDHYVACHFPVRAVNR